MRAFYLRRSKNRPGWLKMSVKLVQPEFEEKALLLKPWIDSKSVYKKFYKYFLILNGCCVNHRQAYPVSFNLIVTFSYVRMKFTIVSCCSYKWNKQGRSRLSSFLNLEELKVTLSRSPSQFLSSCVTEFDCVFCKLWLVKVIFLWAMLAIFPQLVLGNICLNDN